MNQERYKLGSFVSLILRKDDKVLLIRRFQTGSEDGMYGCAGGGLDPDETITQAAIREAAEELGIGIRQEDLKVVHVVHRKTPTNKQVIGFFFEAVSWQGTPANKEPHKCDDIQWFYINDLPNNTQPTFKHVVQMLDKKVFYSEFGWE